MERRSKVYSTKTYQSGVHFSLAQRYLKKNTPDAAMTWSVFIMKISALTLLEKLISFITTCSPGFRKKRTYFTHAALCDIIVQDIIRSVFPNLDIAVSIFLKTFMLTNVSAERYFSQLKRV